MILPKPPTKVKCGMHVIRIEVRELEEASGYAKDNMTIILDSGQELSMMQETLWHELKHICWRVAGLDDKHEDEERAIRGTSPWEILILRDNPKLVEFLLAEAS